MYDYHIHTNMTVDASMTTEQVAKRALNLGLKEICITNHQEWPSVDSQSYEYASDDEAWNKFFRDLDDARKIFPTIKLGCELGYFPEFKSEVLGFARKYPFDYIIGSVHRVKDFYVSGFEQVSNGTDLVRWYRMYFNLLKEAILNNDFDCVGHFDIVKKSAPSLELGHYINEVKACIDAIKEKDVGFELNTMGWNHRCRECYPSPEILKMLHAAGIRKVTIGSDSHTADKIGSGIQKGLSLLKEIGFKEVCTFTRRKPEFHSI